MFNEHNWRIAKDTFPKEECIDVYLGDSKFGSFTLLCTVRAIVWLIFVSDQKWDVWENSVSGVLSCAGVDSVKNWIFSFLNAHLKDE